MKKITSQIAESSKKFIRVFAQIGIGEESKVIEVKNATKAKAIAAVKEFYSSFFAAVKEGEMPESFLSVYAYDEKYNHYQSSPIVEISYRQS